MPLPDITHLQFLLLSTLRAAEMSGRELREELSKEGERKTAPAFYQLMARMEEQGFVEGWYIEKVVEGQRIRERHYKLEGLGERALTDACRFYQGRAEGLVLEGVMAGG